MKQFACGSVVAGCDARFVYATESEILEAVASHAAADHGLLEVPAEVVQAVRANIVAA